MHRKIQTKKQQKFKTLQGIWQILLLQKSWDDVIFLKKLLRWVWHFNKQFVGVPGIHPDVFHKELPWEVVGFQANSKTWEVKICPGSWVRSIKTGYIYPPEN